MLSETDSMLSETDSSGEMRDYIIDDYRENDEPQAARTLTAKGLFFLSCVLSGIGSITVLFAILIGWFAIDYQALIKDNMNLEAELWSEKKSLRLVQMEHLDYVTAIDDYERNIDHWKQDIISTKDTAKNLRQEIEELKKKVPCIKIIVYAVTAVLHANEFSALFKRWPNDDWNHIIRRVHDNDWIIIKVFGTTDRLEMLKKHLEKMKEWGVRVIIFSMHKSREEIESLFSWDEKKHYYPVEIGDKPPNDSPLMCMLLPDLMRDDRKLGRDEVLFVARDVEPEDKCLCKTHNVEGDTGLNQVQLEAIEGIVGDQACRN